MRLACARSAGPAIALAAPHQRQRDGDRQRDRMLVCVYSFHETRPHLSRKKCPAANSMCSECIGPRRPQLMSQTARRRRQPTTHGFASQRYDSPCNVRAASQRHLCLPGLLTSYAPHCGHREANVKRISIRVRLIGMLGAAALAGRLQQRRQRGLGSGQAADPGTVDFPIAYVKRTIPDGRRTARAGRCARSARHRARCGSVLPRSRLAFLGRAQHHRTRDRHRPLRHQGCRCLAGWHEDRLRHARPARRQPGRGRSADLGRSGNTTSPTDDLHRVISLRHHRQRRP